MPNCCGRSFNSNGIRNHLDNSFAHRNEIECGWCYQRWPTHDGKLRLWHEQDEHWQSCSYCNFRCPDSEDLADHEDDEHPSNYCYGCERRFVDINALDQHLKSRVPAGNNVKCPWCPRKFVNLAGICVHLESGSCESCVDTQMVNQYCMEVDRSHIFTTKRIELHCNYDSKTPIATNAAWDGDCSRCYLCSRGFGRLSSLNTHLKSPVHQEKIYHCPRCHGEFILLSGLVAHLESETCGAFRFQRNFSGLAFVNQLKIGF